MKQLVLLLPLFFVFLACDVQMQNPFLPTVARDYFPELEGGGLFGSGDVTIEDGVQFNVGVSSSIEMAIPHDLYGGIGYTHFETIFYRSDGGELDYTGSLEDDLSTLPEAAISIDGDFTDWEGIETYYVDPAGDQHESIAGADLTDFVMARDDSYLYVRFVLADESPNTENIYVLHMADSAGFGWGSAGFSVEYNGSSWTGTTIGSAPEPSDGPYFTMSGTIDGQSINIDTSTPDVSIAPGQSYGEDGVAYRILDSSRPSPHTGIDIGKNSTYTAGQTYDVETDNLEISLLSEIFEAIYGYWGITASSGTLTLDEWDGSTMVGSYQLYCDPSDGDYDVSGSFNVEF